MGEVKPPLRPEDEKYRPLLERREEIKIEVNKLMDEYKALGDILTENIYLRKTQKKKYREREKGEER